MKSRLKKIGAYIFRGWEDEPGYTHPIIKILPPIILEAVAYFIGLFILYQIGLYPYNSIIDLY
jgi:hypothetical protein